MGDDGVGIKVGKILKERGYRVEELGTDVFLLQRRYKGEDRVIIVDAILSDESGKVVHLKGEEIFQKLKAEIRSAHFMGAIEGLRLLIELDERLRRAELHFIGITIREENIKPNLELSEEARKAIPKALEVIERITREKS